MAHDCHERLVDVGSAAEESVKAIELVWICGWILGYAPKRLADETDDVATGA